jgi:hypothetical protein
VGAQPDEIVDRIDRQRNRLTDNLRELETRFQDATDWRIQYERHPWAMLGIVFGGGLLLGAWLGGGSRDGAEGAHSGGTKPAHKQIAEAVRGALITLAVNQLKNYIAERAASQQEHTATEA